MSIAIYTPAQHRRDNSLLHALNLPETPVSYTHLTLPTILLV